jgi:hypothetical protein
MADNTTNSAPNTSEGEGKNTSVPEGGQPAPQAGATFDQAAVDKIVKERLAEEKRRTEAAAKKTADEAEAKRLAEQGEFKTLADQHKAAAEATAAERDTLQGRVGELETVIGEMLETRLKALSPEAKQAVESLPAGDALARLRWLNANEALFTPKQQGAGQGTPTRTQPTRQQQTPTQPAPERSKFRL